VKSAPFVLLFLLFVTSVFGEDNKTILGPSNVALQEGADALRAGDANEGIKLTLLGLSQARGTRERQTAKSNLCAGYTLLAQYKIGLQYCNEVLQDNDRHWHARSNRALIYIKLRRFEEANQDLIAGEKISPNSKTLKAVRKMYLDATDPVAPSVVIDDRRESNIEDADAE